MKAKRKVKAERRLTEAFEKIKLAEQKALMEKSQKRGPRVMAIRAEGKTPLCTNEMGMAVWAYDSTGVVCCGHKNQSYGKVRPDLPNYSPAKNPYCLRRDVRFPHGRCSKHAPKAIGINSPRFKGGRTLHGRDTRYAGLPPSMLRAVEEAMDNPNLTSMREDIAAFDQRIKEITSALGGLDPEIAKRVFDSCKILDKLISREYDPEELDSELRQHLEIVKELQKKERNWRELQSAQLHRAKLAETENKRVTSEQTQIPVEKVAGLCQRIGKGIGLGIQGAAAEIAEKWFSWPDEKKTSIMLQELVIQTCTKYIMEDLRPVISQFFPRPIEVQEAVNRVAEERIENGFIVPDESTVAIAPTIED